MTDDERAALDGMRALADECVAEGNLDLAEPLYGLADLLNDAEQGEANAEPPKGPPS